LVPRKALGVLVVSVLDQASEKRLMSPRLHPRQRKTRRERSGF
jgi:hypothetical protein